MSQPANKQTDPERGNSIQDDPPVVQPPSAQNQPSQGDSNFGDSSGPLFSLYSKIAEEEDNKMTDRWQKDADGILIFVSDLLAVLIALYITCSTVDGSIFCYGRCAACSVRPGSQAKFTRHLRILSWAHLSDSCRSKHHGITHVHPIHYRHAAPVLSSEIRCLGEFTLVFEPGDQSYMCSLGNIVTSMVTSIHQTHPAVTMQPGEASTIARFFC